MVICIGCSCLYSLRVLSSFGTLAFLCDITKHLTALNLQLQVRNRVIMDMHDAVKAFQAKLRLWEIQMPQGNLCHFPCCQTITNQVSNAAFPNAHFVEKTEHTSLCSHDALLPLKLRNLIYNCSVIHLRLTWKKHLQKFRLS